MMTPLKLRTLSRHLRPEAQKRSAVEFVALNSQYFLCLSSSFSTVCMFMSFSIHSSIYKEVAFLGQHQRTSNQSQKHFYIS